MFSSEPFIRNVICTLLVLTLIYSKQRKLSPIYTCILVVALLNILYLYMDTYSSTVYSITPNKFHPRKLLCPATLTPFNPCLSFFQTLHHSIIHHILLYFIIHYHIRCIITSWGTLHRLLDVALIIQPCY